MLIETYIMGLIVSSAGLSEHQQSVMNAAINERYREAKRLRIMIPGFAVRNPRASLHVGILEYVLRLERGGLIVDVGGLPHGPEPEAVLRYLCDCDEIWGFPARGRMRFKPDRVWSAYRMVEDMNKQQKRSPWPAGVKIIQPWISSTFGAAVKAGKK